MNIELIRDHFQKWYPKEGCGVLVAIKGKKEWVPCNNVSEDESSFVIDSKQYIAASRRGDIVGIVHSHPDASSDASETDTKYCNAMGIPYYIFSYPDMDLNVVQPERLEKSLYGRDYEFGVNDCFEAMRDYLSFQGISIPPRAAFEDDWWHKSLDYFTDEIIKNYGYAPVEGNMKPNDVIIFKINASVGNHCGVYLGDDVFFHHAENRISCRENLYPFWKQHISGVYRHEA